MSAVGPTSQHPTGHPVPAPAPAIERAHRLSAGNMVRSLLPLVLICLVIVGWTAFRQSGAEQLREIDPTSTVELAAARADYPVLAPTGLPEGYVPTSARTDAGVAEDSGGPVTLQVGYVTPEREYVGFVVSDDPGAAAVTDVLRGSEPGGSVEVAGETWQRSVTARGETALSREVGGVTVLVTGSADEQELATVAAAVRPVAG